MSNDSTFTGFNRFAENSELSPHKAASTVDIKHEKYRRELAGLSLTEEQETEVLQILWSIMWHFAKMGQTLDVCGLFFAEGIPCSEEQDEDRIVNSLNLKESHRIGGKEAK